MDVVRDPVTKIPAIVTELVDMGSVKKFWEKVSPSNARFYMHEALKAVAYCHQRGVMHRDIKPHNIMIDEENRKVRLIDFGQAEFYEPGRKYSPKVAAIFYKAPELLLGVEEYTPAVDIWAFGCTLAGIVF